VAKQTRAKEQTNKWRTAAPKTQPAPSPVSLASRFEVPNELDGAKPKPGPLLTEPTLEPSDTPAEVGGAAPNDALEDVEKGEGTYLNTREWKFASFMNRVKQAVSAKWDPNGRLKDKEPQRQLLAPRNTVLAVALRPDGSIADIFVMKPCGIDSLDREAVAAFERAAPFPNVPEALIDNGYVRFQFGFTLTPQSGFMPTMSPYPARL
jgi:TonB family protein